MKFEVQAKSYNISKGQLRFQFDPWRYNIITNNSSRGPKHGQSERQIVFFMPKNMLRKAKNKKNGNHPTNLSRWKAHGEHRKSLGFIGIGEKEFMLYDQIALEKHDFSATKAERIQNSKHWVISINAEGPQLPPQQRPDIMPQQKENVSDYKTSIWRKQSSSTNQFIRANKCVKIRISKSKDVKIMITLLIGKQDENGTKSSRKTCRILRLRRPHHGRILHGKIGLHGGGVLQSLTKGSE